MGSYVTLGSLLALTEQFRREFDVHTSIVNVELYGHKGNNGGLVKIWPLICVDLPQYGKTSFRISITDWPDINLWRRLNLGCPSKVVIFPTSNQKSPALGLIQHQLPCTWPMSVNHWEKAWSPGIAPSDSAEIQHRWGQSVENIWLVKWWCWKRTMKCVQAEWSLNLSSRKLQKEILQVFSSLKTHKNFL